MRHRKSPTVASPAWHRRRSRHAGARESGRSGQAAARRHASSQARIRPSKPHVSRADASAPVRTAGFLGNERFIMVMSGMESTVRVYSEDTRKLVGNWPVPGFTAGNFERGTALPWTTDSEEPLYLVGNSQGLNLFDALTGELVAELDPGSVWEMRWSPDGKVLVCVRSEIPAQTSEMTFFVLDGPRSLRKVKTVYFEERIDGWDLSDDNRYLALTFYPSDSLDLVDLHTGETVWRVSAPQYSNTVDISPDGSTVAVGGNHIILLSTGDPGRRAIYTRFDNNIHRARFSPSGDAVAVTSYDGHVRILSTDVDASSLKLLKDLRHGGTARVYIVEFAVDGSRLLSPSGDETGREWGGSRK